MSSQDEAIVFNSRVVEHPAYKQILNQLELVRLSKGLVDLRGSLFLANTGVGKTFTLSNFVAGCDEGKVVVIDSPPEITLNSIIEELLEALRDPKPETGTVTMKRRRLRRLLEEREIQMIIIDEIQDLLPRGKLDDKTRGIKLIKWLMNNTNIPVALAGLPYCITILQADKQIASRFNNVIELHSYSMLNDSEKLKYFTFMKSLLSAFPRPVKCLMNESGLKRFLLATNGLPRTIKSTLTTAIQLTEKDQEVDREVLSVVWQRSVTNFANTIDPFRATDTQVKNALIDMGLLAKVVKRAVSGKKA